MEPRSIKELLMLVREHIDISKTKEMNGLCAIFLYLEHMKYITEDEYFILDSYIECNPPRNAKRRHRKYSSVLGLYWWEPRNFAPRIKWLDEQILKL